MADDPGAETVDQTEPPQTKKSKAGPNTPWVELRIHGVSGTPPESLLGSAHVVQAGGDDKRRVFRRSDQSSKELPRDHNNLRLLEGYHWGNLTSGSWRQALWLLLIPFGIVNAAAFMLPGRQSGSTTHQTGARRFFGWVCHASLRLLALTLTCLFAFTVCFICVELAGMRKAASLNLPNWARDGGAAGIGLVAAGLVVFVLYWVGGRSGRFKEPELHKSYLGRNHSRLADWSFLSGDPSAPDMRRLHLGAGWLTTALPVLVLLRDQFGDGPADVHYRLWQVAIGGLCVIAAIVFLSKNPEDAVGESGSQQVWRAGIRIASWSAFGVGLAVVVVTALRIAIDGLGDAEGLAGIPEMSFVLLLLIVALLLVLAAANLTLAVLTRTPSPPGMNRHFRRYALGNAASVVATTSVMVALGFTGAACYVAARALGVPADDLPDVLQRVTYAWGWTALLAIAVVVLLIPWWVVRAAWPKPPLRLAARADFNADDGGIDRLRVEETWLPRVASAMWEARLKNLATLFALVFGVAGVLLSLAAFDESAASWKTLSYSDGSTCPRVLGLPSQADWCISHRPTWWANLSGLNDDSSFLVGLGSFALVGLGGLLVGVGRGAIKAQSKRRAANVFWDVIAFWPHSVHPFAPPAYSQAVILNFRDRVRFHLYGGLTKEERAEAAKDGTSRLSPATPVVIAAHSQGSLIAVASMLWLNDDEREYVGLVTFGSQLQLMFSRAFPDYVNYWLLQDLLWHDSLDRRWVNLYRETDPIAGPVLSWQHQRSTTTGSMESSGFPLPPPGDGSAGETAPPMELLPDEIVPRTGRRVCGRRVTLRRGCDWRLLDPTPSPGFDVEAEKSAVAVMRGHSQFFADPEWDTAVDAVRQVWEPTVAVSLVDAAEQ